MAAVPAECGVGVERGALASQSMPAGCWLGGRNSGLSRQATASVSGMTIKIGIRILVPIVSCPAAPTCAARRTMWQQWLPRPACCHPAMPLPPASQRAGSAKRSWQVRSWGRPPPLFQRATKASAASCDPPHCCNCHRAVACKAGEHRGHCRVGSCTACSTLECHTAFEAIIMHGGTVTR